MATTKGCILTTAQAILDIAKPESQDIYSSASNKYNVISIFKALGGTTVANNPNLKAIVRKALGDIQVIWGPLSTLTKRRTSLAKALIAMSTNVDDAIVIDGE